MTKRNFHLLFYGLVLAILALAWVGHEAALLLWALLLVLTPVWAWRVHRSASAQRPRPQGWVRAAYLLSGLSITLIWLGLAGLMLLFVSLMNPWPLSLYQHYAVKTHLLETGFIPATAANVVVRDDHGGFHGDGRRLVIFDYGSQSLDELQPVRQLTLSAAARGVSFEWRTKPFDERSQATLQTLAHFDIDPVLWPDTDSAAIGYWCDDTSDYRPYQCGHLYIHDPNARRFWYINITD